MTIRPLVFARTALLLLLTQLCALVSPGAVAFATTTSRTAADCASTLDCTAAELDAMPMRERVVLVRSMQDLIAGELVPGFRHWRSIEGIIFFFAEKGMGRPGTWVSHVDAGALEGMERGAAIALGRSGDDFGNPGSRLWADYLQRMQRGELTERWEHDPAWGNAEQASIEQGVRIAEANGTRPSRVDWNIYEFSELYRWILRNPQRALFMLNDHVDKNTGVPVVPVDFLRWLTDVTTPVPTYRGGHAVYDLSRPDPVGAPTSVGQLLLAYAPELFRVYQEELNATPPTAR